VGEFNIHQNMEGRIAEFNMWDYEMSGEELRQLNCTNKGNVINWDSLQLLNQPTIGSIVVPVCAGIPSTSPYHSVCIFTQFVLANNI